MGMVEILLDLITAERDGNWTLRLDAFAAMLPWLTIYDHTNYARRAVSILGFENCQSFFSYNCPCTYGVPQCAVHRNARRTAMRGAHQFDCHNTCQTLKTAAEHHIQTTV